MAKQITQLPVAASVAASDVFPLDQSGTTKQATLTAIAAGLPAGTGTGGLVRQVGPSISGTDTICTFVGAPGAGGFTGLRVVCSDASAANFRTAFWDIANELGINVASIFGLVGTDGSSAFTFSTTPPGARNSDRRVERVRVTSDGNLGIGTTNTPSKLTVAGDIRLANNTNALLFTDQSGTTPYLQAQADGQFWFYSTTVAGAARPVWNCATRSDTSPFLVNVPLKIGADGSSIASVYSAVVTHTPATIAANGGVQFLDVTITGLTAGCNLFVNSFSLSNTSIIVRAEFQANNTARIYWVNPTASPVTLSSAIYRVSGIVFA